MLRVRSASGPTTAKVDDQVMYRVDSFNEPAPNPRNASKVSWLIKSTNGDALAYKPGVGPELQLAIPETWAGETAIVMPYMKSPSTSVSVRTTIGDRPSPPRPGPAGGTRNVEVVRDREKFYASVDGEPSFYLGTRVRYDGRRGLTNVTNPQGIRYRPENYEAPYGHWAWYLWPTIMCESQGFFTCLNTYDRGAFTFGHIQLAAHTPDDNFVLFLRELLRLPEAVEYFPNLTLESNGRIHLIGNGGRRTPLESASSTAGLMRYFNPTAEDVDDLEADRAARMVDWCRRYPSVCERQVAFAAGEQKRKFKAHAKRLSMNEVVDKLCLVVLDILHQGRGKYAAIDAALHSLNPFDELLSIGASAHARRIATLRARIRDLEEQGRVGEKVYDIRSGDFIIPTNT